MIRPSRLLRGAAVLAVCGMLVLSFGARGNWYDSYLDGVAALERGDAARAAELIELAVSRKPRSGYHRTYGTNFIHYTPHSRLARAYELLGRCEAALEQARLADEAGEAHEVPELRAVLDATRRHCAPPPPAPAATAPPAVKAAASGGAVDSDLMRRALSAYLAGDLDLAIRSFERAAADAPDSAVARLMLGASLHAAWSLGGKTNDAMRTRWQAAFADAAARDPHLAAPPSLLPPELIQVYSDYSAKTPN